MWEEIDEAGEETAECADSTQITPEVRIELES